MARNEKGLQSPEAETSPDFYFYRGKKFYVIIPQIMDIVDLFIFISLI